MGQIKQGDSGATVTREQWILPLLRTLGFEGITFSPSVAQVGGETYFISHPLGEGVEGLPIHIEGARNNLDRRPPTGRPRISPHALVQDYLNRTEHLWGIVTNGLQLRILRDPGRLSRPSYLEFDLQQIMEGELFSEFQVFYRIVHRSRWPRDVESGHECILEQYCQLGIESDGRGREHLRDGVEDALKIFGNGFIVHPDNKDLRQQIREGRLDAIDYYRQFLSLVYRFFFLMVSEERNVVGPDPENDPRVLELVYTAHDMKSFAEGMGYEGPPFKWDEERRALLGAELDAYYAKLYSLSRDELRYILDPQDVYGPNFPGETFRVLKEKEVKQYGEYRTRRLVLEARDRLFGKK